MHRRISTILCAATLALVTACGGDSEKEKAADDGLSSDDKAGIAAMREANPNLTEKTDEEVIESAESICTTLDAAGVDRFMDGVLAAAGSRNLAPGLMGELVQAIKWKCPEHEDPLREWTMSRQ